MNFFDCYKKKTCSNEVRSRDDLCITRCIRTPTADFYTRYS